MASQTHPTGPNFTVKWALVTALLGFLVTFPAMASMYVYPLIAFAGLVIGIGQWWLLRGTVPRAWRWLVGSFVGWLLAMAVAAGIFYGSGMLIYRVNLFGSPSIWTVRVMQVVFYFFAFGVLAATQVTAVRGDLPGAARYILLSAAGGALVGLIGEAICAAGGSASILAAVFGVVVPDGTGVCFPIGVTIPRLQTAEPLFNWAWLSIGMHAAGWLIYGAVVGPAMRTTLTTD